MLCWTVVYVPQPAPLGGIPGHTIIKGGHYLIEAHTLTQHRNIFYTMSITGNCSCTGIVCWKICKSLRVWIIHLHCIVSAHLHLCVCVCVDQSWDWMLGLASEDFPMSNCSVSFLSLRVAGQIARTGPWAHTYRRRQTQHTTESVLCLCRCFVTYIVVVHYFVCIFLEIFVVSWLTFQINFPAQRLLY